MKKLLSSKVIIAILCVCILALSIGLFAMSPEEAEAKCSRYCSKKYGGSSALYEACFRGCMFGALN
jgi:hypothetical protein